MKESERNKTIRQTMIMSLKYQGQSFQLKKILHRCRGQKGFHICADLDTKELIPLWEKKDRPEQASHIEKLIW